MPAPDGSFFWKGQEIRLSYLAEGAANIVYKISASPGKPLPPPLDGMVLRLHKQNPSGLLYNTIIEHFDKAALLLAPSDVLQPKLWPRPNVDLIGQLNRSLESAEAQDARPRKRHGVYLDRREPNTMLIADMSPRTEHERLVEFKPKWLLQSPSAPPKSKRCRTCALKAMRQVSSLLLEGDRTEPD